MASEFSLASEFSVPGHNPSVEEIPTSVMNGHFCASKMFDKNESTILASYFFSDELCDCFGVPESVSRGCVSVSRIQPHVVMCRVRMT